MDNNQQQLTSLSTAINVMYDPFTSKNMKQEANQYLKDFQSNPVSWGVCTFVLLNPFSHPFTLLLFCSQTLKSKIQTEGIMLEAEDFMSLKTTLIQIILLLTDSNLPSKKTILIQLCICVSALIISKIEHNEMIINNFVEEMVKQQQINKLEMLFMFFKILNEEVMQLCHHSQNLTNSEFAEIHELVVQKNSNRVLFLIENCLSLLNENETNNTIELEKSLLDCLKVWISSGDINILESKTNNQQLLSYIFNCLYKNVELSELASELISVLVEENHDCGDSVFVEFIYPNLLYLSSKINNTLEKMNENIMENETQEIVRSISQVFVTTSDVYLYYLINEHETLKVLLETIINCINISNIDIIGISLNFWGDFCDRLLTQNNNSKIIYYTEILKKLLVVIINKLMFPQDTNDLSKEEYDDFKIFRHDVGDILKNCCNVLEFQTTVAIIYTILYDKLSNNKIEWQYYESALFALRTIGSCVDITEDVYLPQILGIFPKLPKSELINYTMVLVVSRYSFWLKYNSKYIPFCIEFIKESLNLYQTNKKACVMALKYLCKDCPNEMKEYLDYLFEISTVFNFETEDVLQLYEGVGYILNIINEDIQLIKIMVIVDGIISQDKTTVEIDQMNISIIDILLRCIYDSVVENNTNVSPVLTKTELFIDNILPKISKKGETCSEIVCKYFKTCITSYTKQYKKYIPRLLNKIRLIFNEQNLGCYIWILRKIIVCYCEGETNEKLEIEIFSTFDNIINTFYNKYTTKIPQFPDVCEEMCLVIECLIDGNACLFNELNSLDIIIQFLIIMFRANEYYVLDSLIGTWKLMISISINSQLTKISQIIQKYSFNFTDEIIKMLTTNCPKNMKYEFVLIVTLFARNYTSNFIQSVEKILDSGILNISQNKKNDYLFDIKNSIQNNEWIKVEGYIQSMVDECSKIN